LFSNSGAGAIAFCIGAKPAPKLIAVVLLLVWIGTARAVTAEFVGFYGGLLAFAIVISRLPVTKLLARAALVLPFAGTFALMSLLAGDPERAVSLTVKSVYSGLAVLLLAATTPMPDLLRSGEKLAPRNAGGGGSIPLSLLVRSLRELHSTCGWRRIPVEVGAGTQPAARQQYCSARPMHARRIHRAMLARGFSGQIEVGPMRPVGVTDVGMVLAVAVLLIGGRLLWGL
jgi:energy-coupling factor transporter transmembrane protein EcfT